MKKLSQSLLLLILFCTAALAADLPRVAVYVTGDIPDNEKSAFGTRMLASLINSGRYMGIERSGSFLAEVEREQLKQRSGAIDDSQISELGRQFGVKYVCIAAITPAFGSFQVSARIVDVETAVVVHIGEAFSPLKEAQDLMQASDEVVTAMFAGKAAPAPSARTSENVIEDGRMRIEADPKPAGSPQKSSIKPTTWAAIGLDVLGAGLIVYGLVENGNVGHYNSKAGHDKVSSSAKTRNIVYGIGAAALLGGVSVHIFF